VFAARELLIIPTRRRTVKLRNAPAGDDDCK